MKCWQQIEMLLKSPIVNTNEPSRSSSSHGFSETRTNPMGSQDILDFDDDDGITINCGPPGIIFKSHYNYISVLIINIPNITRN